ncbi:MAG: hypothetical protein EOP56_09285 [Sphingobacteriales bacterium]|nr:MAG: hypothetical protein EOP56_09285 [Sphingobacteriales bacterium]
MKDIISTLQQRYPQGEYRILKEVQYQNRSADFIIVSLWPSRGLSIIGIERKSYRSDWLSELKKPAKAEAIYNCCDYWYLLTDNENVAKIEEIPETWGWLHIKDGKTFEMKKAPRIPHDSTDVNRTFAVSVIRRSTDGMIHESAIKDRIEAAKIEGSEQAKRELERSRKNVASEYEYLKRAVAEFEEKSGVQIQSWSGARIGDAVNFVLQGGIERQKKELNELHGRTTRILNAINLGIGEQKTA